MLYFLSFVLLIIVCLPRFNQNNFWILKNFVGNQGHLKIYSIDTQNYIGIIDYFKGDKSKLNSISVPYIYRVLPTYLASLLPFNSLTNLNLLNLFSLLIALWIQILTLEKYKINKGLIILANILFIFSFPLFYFGTSGVVDPFFIMLLYASIFCIMSKQNIAFLVLIFLASMSKESAIILIPFYLYYNEINLKSLIYLILGMLIFLGGTYFSRNVITLSSSYFWTMDFEHLMINLTRARSYLSYVIAYLYFVPFIIYFLKMKYFKTKIEFAYLLGIVLANALFLYSFWAAYPDACLIWPAYPFTIIYLSLSLNKFLINSAYKVG